MSNSDYIDAYLFLSNFLSEHALTFDEFFLWCFIFTFAFFFVFIAMLSVFADGGYLLYKKVLKPVFLWQFRKFKAWLDRSGKDHS